MNGRTPARTALLLMLPLLAFLLFAYIIPFLGIARWSVTEPIR